VIPTTEPGRIGVLEIDNRPANWQLRIAATVSCWKLRGLTLRYSLMASQTVVGLNGTSGSCHRLGEEGGNSELEARDAYRV
jgi:hypothetical protein